MMESEFEFGTCISLHHMPPVQSTVMAGLAVYFFESEMAKMMIMFLV